MSGRNLKLDKWLDDMWVPDQRSVDSVDKRSGVMGDSNWGSNLVGNNSWGLNNRLDNWSMGNSNSWGSSMDQRGSWEGSSVEGGGEESVENWVNGDWGSLGWECNWGWDSDGSSSWDGIEGRHNWSWGSNNRCSMNNWSNWGSHSWGNGVNKSILVEVLRESLQSNGSESLGGGDQVSNSWGQGSRDWAIIDIGSSSGSNNWGSGDKRSSNRGSRSKQDLWVSLSLSLVQVDSVDRLVSTG